MNPALASGQHHLQCAIYTRKSSEEGLEQSFNSLHAQREACEAYIKSQHHEGWRLKKTHYDDGGFSGGNMARPALTRLIDDIKQGYVNIIVVYKVDRLSRSLADFVRLIELCDQHSVSFVSVTQQFNTSTSMGRLTLNVLLSFAQFEREVTGERIRDKIAASKQKGMWMGGVPPLGYDVESKHLVVNTQEAQTVRHIHQRYLALGCVRKLKAELDNQGYLSKLRHTENGTTGGKPFSRGALYTILRNPLYIGKVRHKEHIYDGQHPAIIEEPVWEQTQQRLAMNRVQMNTGQLSRDPSLLAGLLYDDRGHRMSPTHTRKGTRRYRYYISQAVLKYRESDGGSVIRIAANVIENTITDEIRRLFSSGHEILSKVVNRELTATDQKQLITKASSLADNWDRHPPRERIPFLQKIIQRIAISQNSIDIHYSRSGITGVCLQNVPDIDACDDTSNDIYQVSIPAQLKRCGIETKLIVSDTTLTEAHERTVRAIQDALRKAMNWNQALVTGKVATMTELARAEGVTQRYIAHIIKLAFLAPDIMDAIIKGNIPVSLSLGTLKKGVPLDWKEQRESFGFN